MVAAAGCQGSPRAVGLVRGAGISRWRFGAPVAIHLAKGLPGASDLEASDHHSLFAHAKCNRDSVARIRGEFEALPNSNGTSDRTASSLTPVYCVEIIGCNLSTVIDRVENAFAFMHRSGDCSCASCISCTRHGSDVRTLFEFRSEHAALRLCVQCGPTGVGK